MASVVSGAVVSAGASSSTGVPRQEVRAVIMNRNASAAEINFFVIVDASLYIIVLLLYHN